jgi:hypothetical protein
VSERAAEGSAGPPRGGAAGAILEVAGLVESLAQGDLLAAVFGAVLEGYAGHVLAETLGSEQVAA